ncbi:MAG: Uma2 family endonuclease, partial [Chloroflexi bacterium]|nr:Uma2 family endonuclease [Chloroflexota bacterium]
MATANAKFVTAEELLLMPELECRYELVRGELLRKPFLEHLIGFYTANIGAELAMFVQANRLGRAYSPNAGFLLERDPDTVFAPSASFVRQERVEAVGDGDGYFPGAPDFVAEIISPSDRLADVYSKVEEWLDAGALMVMVVNPRNKTVQVYR